MINPRKAISMFKLSDKNQPSVVGHSIQTISPKIIEKKQATTVNTRWGICKTIEKMARKIPCTKRYNAINRVNRPGESEIPNTSRIPKTISKTPVFILCIKSQTSLANKASILSRIPSIKMTIPQMGNQEKSETDKIEPSILKTLAIAKKIPIISSRHP